MGLVFVVPKVKVLIVKTYVINVIIKKHYEARNAFSSYLFLIKYAIKCLNRAIIIITYLWYNFTDYF
ncbi:hypothetical protein ASG01_02155 [Chryseobacterium sp. Leaf180]|nr:hypothetical protein ASG01_02155 [Chryseobacterium sp. Leaf180]